MTKRGPQIDGLHSMWNWTQKQIRNGFQTQTPPSAIQDPITYKRITGDSPQKFPQTQKLKIYIRKKYLPILLKIDNVTFKSPLLDIRHKIDTLHKACSSPRQTIFLHALSFQCTSKLCVTFINQFLVYFHIKTTQSLNCVMQHFPPKILNRYSLNSRIFCSY